MIVDLMPSVAYRHPNHVSSFLNSHSVHHEEAETGMPTRLKFERPFQLLESVLDPGFAAEHSLCGFTCARFSSFLHKILQCRRVFLAVTEQHAPCPSRGKLFIHMWSLLIYVAHCCYQLHQPRRHRAFPRSIQLPAATPPRIRSFISSSALQHSHT